MTDQDANSSLARAYAQLLSLAVHEFRTPASVVSGYLRMLQRDMEQPLNDRHRKMVDDAERSVGRLVALITELSEISKIDAAQVNFREETFDLFEMAQEAAAEIHDAQDRGVKIEVRKSGGKAPLTGDRVRLHAAFGAFVRAVAREQTADKLVIVDCQLKTDGAEPLALVAVGESNAIGPALEAQAAPFEENRGGLGLTLPIARRVIERYGGRVWSPLVAPGSGSATRTAIIVSLPLRQK